MPNSTPAPELSNGVVSLRRRTTDVGIEYIVEVESTGVGGLTVVDRGDGVAELDWDIADDDDLAGPRITLRALTIAIRHCFDQLGFTRVEARLDPADRQAHRLASRSGMRQEGVARQVEGTDGARRDRIVLARLADDADPQERDGFIATLNAWLPKKRVIAHGLLFDELGRVLLCELTYKREWDLPGGVVESGESPALAVVREIKEELGIDVGEPNLVTINWLPAWRGWDDACQFVFDCGVIESSTVEKMTLQPTEIVAVHWCDAELIATRGAAVTATLLRDLAAERATDGGCPIYREAQ